MQQSQTTSQPDRPPSPAPEPPKRWHFQNPQRPSLTAYILTGLALLLVIAALIAGLVTDPADMQTGIKRQTEASGGTATPQLRTDVIVSKGENIWDTVFLPDGRMLFTERHGEIHIYDKGKVTTVATLPMVRAQGEGGLLGLVVDNDYAANNYIYACYSTDKDIRVSRWRMTPQTTLSEQNDIITGIPTNTSGSPGRHSGCRVGFGPDGNLWVGTGDTAQGDTSI